MKGPIDYIVVGFEGNTFDGSILGAVGDAVDSGAIDLVALAIVTKNNEGTVMQLDVVNAGDGLIEAFAQKYATNTHEVDSDDISEVGDLLENNTSAGLLIVEQLWAKPLKQALINAKGVIVVEGRIHPDAELELDNEGDA